MKKHLFILAVVVGLVGCATESRTVVREVDEPAGSTTVIDVDDDADRDIDFEADLDVPDVDVDVK